MSILETKTCLSTIRLTDPITEADHEGRNRDSNT
jgi:hypothetical protein